MGRLPGWLGQLFVGVAAGAALWSAGYPLAGVAVSGLVAGVLPLAARWCLERPGPAPRGRALARRIRSEERALATQRRLLGDEQPETLTSRNNLALDYAQAGRLPEAVEQYEIALTYGVHVQGPHHPETVILRGNLAEAYHACGRHGAALRQAELAHHSAARMFGPRHRETRGCRVRLARLRDRGAAPRPAPRLAG